MSEQKLCPKCGNPLTWVEVDDSHLSSRNVRLALALEPDHYECDKCGYTEHPPTGGVDTGRKQDEE